VAARGNRHDDDDCRLLSGTPLPSPFSPLTLGLVVTTTAAAGEPSMPPTHWVPPPLRNMFARLRPPSSLDLFFLCPLPCTSFGAGGSGLVVMYAAHAM
jgi:hypothetical protein